MINNKYRLPWKGSELTHNNVMCIIGQKYCSIGYSRIMSLLIRRLGNCVFCLFGALAFFPISGFGQIVWETTFIEKSANLEVNEVYVNFPFKNAGKTPIKILSAHPLCSCTTLNDMKTTYAPGEKGVLSAKFTVGQRTGIQNKYIDVQTDDAPNKTQRLTFRITLPELATVIPNYLIWKMGGMPLSAQTMKLVVTQSDPVHILQATSSDENFKVEVQTVQRGFKYNIVVRPISLLAPFKSSITIRTDYPSTKPREFDGTAEVSLSGK